MGVKVTMRGRSGRIISRFDPDFLVGEINQAGERAVKGVSDMMKKEGEQIQELARDYAPYDDGYLEKSIKVQSGKDENGRVAVTVYVDGSTPAAGGKAVGDYALLMHEGLGPYGSGYYKPGEGTMAKIYAGFKAGGKFLERAFKERTRTLVEKAAAAARRALK